MSPVSQKLSELWQFLWVKVRQNLRSSNFSNLNISLIFWDKILRVIITFIGFKITFSNMVPKTTPSFISNGGYQIPPPLAWDEFDTPWKIGLISNCKLKWVQSNERQGWRMIKLVIILLFSPKALNKKSEIRMMSGGQFVWSLEYPLLD